MSKPAHDLENHMVIPQTPVISDESDSSPHPIPKPEAFDDCSFQELLELCKYTPEQVVKFAFEYIDESLAREEGRERDNYMANMRSTYVKIAIDREAA